MEARLASLQLRRIIREPHSEDVRILERNAIQTGAENVVVSAAADQLHVYDDAHLGRHLDMFMAYRAWDYDVFTACCFVLPVLSERERRWLEQVVEVVHRSAAVPDVWIAVGGKRGRVRLLSVARAREMLVVDHVSGNNLSDAGDEGSGEAVVALAAHPHVAGVWASASAHSIAVWRVSERSDGARLVLRIRVPQVTALAFRPDGRLYGACGHPSQIIEWEVQSSLAAERDDHIDAAAVPEWTAHDGRVVVTRLAAPADALRCLPAGLLVKCGDHLRWLAYTDGSSLLPANQHAKRDGILRIPGGAASTASIDVRTISDATTGAEDTLVAVGGGQGMAYVFRLSDGKRVASAGHPRVRGALGGCLFGSDGETMLVAHQQCLLLYVATAIDAADPAEETNARKDTAASVPATA